MELPSNMQRTILWTSLGLGGVGLFGAFTAHADLVVIAPSWAGLIIKLADQAGHELDRDKALKIATGVALGVAGFVGGVKLANTYLAYTGVGTIPAMLANASANGVLTYLMGKAAAQTFLEKDVTESVENLVRYILGLLTGFLKPQG